MDSSETTRPTPNPSDLQAQSNLSFFTGAHGFRIDQQTNHVVNTAYTTSRDLCSILNPIADASFARDRKASPPDSNCLPGTREKVIGKIRSWIDSSILRNPQHVMWVYGYVGCGKSSIAQAVAELYARKNRLAGSFFFFRGSGDRSKTARFAATMAGQLAAAIPGTAPYVERAVKAHAGLLTTYSIGAQFEHIVYHPLKTFAKLNPFIPSFLRDPYLIVLDGLDECNDREEVALFIEHMLNFFKKNPRIPLRFLITSRVEEHIRTHLDSRQVHLLNLVDHTSLDDISAVVDATFTLAAKHSRVIQTYGDWPSPDDRRKLVEHSGGSVIFMSTLLKFILEPSPDGLAPMERLPLALTINPGLDGLYSQTLSRSEHLPHFSEIVTAIVTFLEPPSISGLADFLSIRNYEVVRVLVNLHSILHVPGDDNTPITICHSSLRDFLHDEDRSRRFFLSTEFQARLMTRLFSRCDNTPSVTRTIATVKFLLEPISIFQLASLLCMEPTTVIAHLEWLRPVLRIPLDIHEASLGPHALHLPAFLLMQTQSGLNTTCEKDLAFMCCRLIVEPPRDPNQAIDADFTRIHASDGDYPRIHAMSHWNGFLKTLPTDAFAAQFDETLLFLEEIVGETIARGVLILLLTMEYCGLDPQVFLPRTVEWITPSASGRRHEQVAAHWVIIKKKIILAGEMLDAIARASRLPLSKLKPDIIDDIPDEMSLDDLEVVAHTHLAMLYTLKRDNTSHHDSSETLQLTHSKVLQLAEDSYRSPLFISEFTQVIAKSWASDTLVTTSSSLRDALATDKVFNNVCYRLLVLAHRRSPHASTIVSTIDLLGERLTVFQLSYLLDIPAITIRSVLGRVHGIIDVPYTSFKRVFFRHGQILRNFLRTRAAKEFYIGPRVEEELVYRCLSTWIEWASVDKDLALLKDHCRDYSIGYWVAAVKDVAVDHIQRCQQLAKAITCFGSFFSPGTVEFVLWTFVATTSGLDPIVQSWEDDDDLKAQAMALGCRQDVARLVGTQVLLCAEAIRVLQRHFLPLGPLVTAEELEKGVWDELFSRSQSRVPSAGAEKGMPESRGCEDEATGLNEAEFEGGSLEEDE